MAIHLLLEERVGTLTEKQVELLLAAREDSDRLHTIVNNLLDIGRIESGKGGMQFQGTSPHVMVLEAVEPFRRPCEDQGVTLNVDLPADLPEVWVDSTRMHHVFGNLLSNALKYTSPGGKITLSAWVDEKPIEFVFLILSPAQTPDIQVQVLGLVSRAAQNRYLLEGLKSAQTPEEAMNAMCDWEAPNDSNPSEMS